MAFQSFIKLDQQAAGDITQGLYSQSRTNLPLLLDREGTGTQTYVQSKNGTEMSVTAGQWALAQTFQRHAYVFGRKLFAHIEFSGFANVANVDKRSGYYSSSTTTPFSTDYDGVWIQSDGTNTKLVIANLGQALTTTILQANWDDPLDGTGDSSINHDFEKLTHIMLVVEAGQIVFRIVSGGEFVTFHTETYNGKIAHILSGSMRQPLRWEIRSSGGAGSMDQLSAAASVSGTSEVQTTPFGVNTGNSVINANTPGTEYLLFSASLKSTSPDAFIRFVSASILGATSQDDFYVNIRFNATIAGAPVAVTPTDASIDVFRGEYGGATTVTGGVIVSSKLFRAQTSETAQASFPRRLGVAVDGTFDIASISVVPLSNMLDVYAALNWLEL